MALSTGELAQSYGFASSFFFSDPELKNLIDRATKEQWSTARFQAEFMSTNWFRTHNSSVRTWTELAARDPQTAARQVEQETVKVRNLASQLGVTLDAGLLDWAAHASLYWGWTDAELRKALADHLAYTGPGGSLGQAGMFDQQIRQAANDYGLAVSDETVGGWVRKMVAGEYTIDNATTQLRDWAMSKYPGLNAQLSEGMTVRQVADPYIQSYATILEKPAAGVQLTDPLIQKALQGSTAPPPGAKSGSTATLGASNGPSSQPAAQSLYDFERSLRQDSRWLTTKNAQDSVRTTALGVLRDWGIYR